MLVICPVFDRAYLFPYYCQHYANLGARKIVALVWSGASNEISDQIRRLKNPLVELARFNGPALDLSSQYAAINRIRQAHQYDFPWCCIADMDEFVYFNGKNFTQIIELAESLGRTSVHCWLVDRLSSNNTFPYVKFGSKLDDLFPMEAKLTQVTRASVDKFPLAKSNLEIQIGHHWTRGIALNNEGVVYHFKWDGGIIERLEKRYEIYTDRKYCWAIEMRDMAKWLKEHRYSELTSYHQSVKLGI